MLPWLQKRRVLTALRIPLKVPLLRPAESYVPIAAFERALSDAMTFGLRGVHLLALPPNNGKTTAATRVANALLESKQISGCVYTDLSSESTLTRDVGPLAGAACLSGMFAQSLGVDPQRLFSEKHWQDSDSLMPAGSDDKPVVFIGDNADDFVFKDASVQADVVSS